MDDAAVNVGSGNGCWILVLAFLTGGFSVILAGLVAGKTQAEMKEPLKMGGICILLQPIFVGWIMACCIACKTNTASG